MPLKVWFFSHVFLTLALGARNSVVAGAAPANLVHNGSFEENSDSGLHTQRVGRRRSPRHSVPVKHQWDGLVQFWVTVGVCGLMENKDSSRSRE